MQIIEKDILTVEKGIICQSVNCQGVMGSGLAKAIREKWPIVYESYIKYCKTFNHDFELLGRWHGVKLNENLIIVNLFNQLFYGYDGKRYTDYSGINCSLKSLKDSYACYSDMPFYFPYLMGCDRGGADWNIVSKMIDFYFPNAIICKLP